MIAAVEFADDPETATMFAPERKVGAAIAAALLRRDVIARAMPEANTIGFAPPLCITADEISIVAKTLRAAADDVLLD